MERHLKEIQKERKTCGVTLAEPALKAEITFVNTDNELAETSGHLPKKWAKRTFSNLSKNYRESPLTSFLKRSETMSPRRHMLKIFYYLLGQ